MQASSDVDVSTQILPSKTTLNKAAKAEYSSIPVQNSQEGVQAEVPQQLPLPQFSTHERPTTSTHNLHVQNYSAAPPYCENVPAESLPQTRQYLPTQPSDADAGTQKAFAAAHANQSDLKALFSNNQPTYGEKHSRLFREFDDLNQSSATREVSYFESLSQVERSADAKKWSVEEAASWIKEHGHGDGATVALMKENEIDGKSLLLMSNHDLELILKVTDAEARDSLEIAISELKSLSGLPSYKAPSEA
ncbi:hypothetical protein HDU80_009121 [Chytriomyces hyalinus]|nr:hypothetical protein HDU80_009121 [Chytriomyces hyalinus]